MAVVGLELSPPDFARVAPVKVAVATATQTILLPVVAFTAIALLDPPIHRTLGLIVIAGCRAARSRTSSPPWRESNRGAIGSCVGRSHWVPGE
ncbi:MAG: hypothetical protein GY953_48950 [bacterium]|nr:hypothetical protein [bacterium]